MNTNPHTHTPLTDILTRLQETACEQFEHAHPIPGAVHHCPKFLDHELRNVFSKDWICIGREDELTEHGDYLTHDIAGVPVMAVRQQNGQIKGFINACAHRFACLLPNQRGSSKRFTCRYHAWTYDCSGELLRAPYMEMKTDFDARQHRLKAIACETWEGFVYLSLEKNPEAIAARLKPLTHNIVGRYDMACYKTAFRESMIWNANWKNLIENFTESYHVPMAHRKTFAQHGKPLQDYICGEDSDFYGYHRAPQASDSGSGAAHPDNNRLQGEWRRMMIDFCVFPCHLVTLMPDYLWWISVQPHGTDKMNAQWGVAFPPEVLADVSDDDYQQWVSDFKTYMDVANDEDKELVEALHKGTSSPILPEGTFHPIERNLWQFNRYLARKCGQANQ